MLASRCALHSPFQYSCSLALRATYLPVIRGGRYSEYLYTHHIIHLSVSLSVLTVLTPPRATTGYNPSARFATCTDVTCSHAPAGYSGPPPPASASASASLTKRPRGESLTYSFEMRLTSSSNPHSTETHLALPYHTFPTITLPSRPDDYRASTLSLQVDAVAMSASVVKCSHLLYPPPRRSQQPDEAYLGPFTNAHAKKQLPLLLPALCNSPTTWPQTSNPLATRRRLK